MPRGVGYLVGALSGAAKRGRDLLAGLDWRREILYPLTASMEVAWFTPWYMALIPATGRLPPARTAVGLFTIMAIPVYAGRVLGRLRLKLAIQRAVIAVLLLLTCVLALRVFLFAGQTYHGLAWLAESLSNVLNVYELIPDWLVIVLSTLYLWWRGISLGQRRLTVKGVLAGFYVGIASFVGFVLLVSLVTEQDPGFFVPVFFFCSLMALAATRMEQMRQWRGAIRSPFGLSWLLAITLAALVVVTLGTLWGAVMTGQDVQTVLRWLAPIFLLVGVVLGVLLAMLRIAIQAVLGLFSGLGLGDVTQPLAELLEGLGDLVPQGPEGGVEVPAGVGAAAGALRLAAMFVIVVGAAVLVIWMVRRQETHRREETEDTHTSLFSTDLLVDNVRRFVRGQQERLGSLLNVLGRSGLRGLFVALTIRRIYAQMQRLAATQGYPRAPSETPYEYEATVTRAFPSAETEVHAITEAYVAVHYGEVPESEAELDRIRASWERLRGSVSV
jgi:hypothetical protein